MDIRVLSWYLLLPQLGAVLFIFAVIIRQVGLLKLSVQKELVRFRWGLLGLAVSVLFLAGILLMVSVITVLGLVERSAQHINAVGIGISVAYNGAIFLAAVLIWMLYRMAGKVLLITERNQSTKTNLPGVE